MDGRAIFMIVVKLRFKKGMRHILLENIVLKRVTMVKPLPNFKYDTNLGAWISILNNSLLINNPKFTSIASKKKDVEIGEDQK